MSTVLAGISGRPVEFFDGSPEAWLQIIHAEDRTRLAEMIEEVLAGRTEKADFEYRLVRADGAIRYMSDSVRTTHVESGRRLDGVSRDVTEVKEGEEERLRLEERFQQAQKLDSLGVLAGGIAHDFNNLLVAMLGHARLAEEDLPQESPIRHNLKSVIKAARQAGDLCGQMLAYAGKVPIDTKAIELDEIVEEIGELLRASIPSSTLIRYSFDKEVPSLRGDASQVRQVALNLITNASESIGDTGGEIMLRVQTTQYDSAGLAEMEFSETLEPGPYVVLTVSDTGCGMDGSIRTKIFEPFYTTKFAGRGLGLAAVVGIVRGHGGAIQIESEIGHGSSVSVIFPAVDWAAASETDLSENEPRPSRGARKVLLVEDEEAARELARIVLERSGIDVVEAADGVEALAIFRLQPEDFDCVLLDLTMPHMDGVETYARLQKVRPDIPVILCSGYPESAAVARFANLGLSGFLKKPYEPEELIACLCDLGPPSASV
jgi:signal transduction histidine kinase/ActR/RegA family two-component response regulator